MQTSRMHISVTEMAFFFNHVQFFFTVLQVWQESKFCMSHWILHGYRNTTKPLRPLRTSTFFDPLPGALIVGLAYYSFHLVLVNSMLRL